ncbi:hypothetical protein FGF82_23410 [Salmonella sp. gx-f9]|nr:hypothetical protein [Salmonella sp. gx-f9]
MYESVFHRKCIEVESYLSYVANGSVLSHVKVVNL